MRAQANRLDFIDSFAGRLSADAPASALRKGLSGSWTDKALPIVVTALIAKRDRTRRAHRSHLNVLFALRTQPTRGRAMLNARIGEPGLRATSTMPAKARSRERNRQPEQPRISASTGKPTKTQSAPIARKA